MLKAKLDSVRKNKKGFSLVELIIVIAIMVALIAVMAPSFVKYVQKSRDAAFQTACEDYFTALKTYYGDPDTDVNTLSEGTVKFKIEDSKLNISYVTINSALQAKLTTVSGIDTAKKMGSTTNQCKITIGKDGTGNYTFKMEYGTNAAA